MIGSMYNTCPKCGYTLRPDDPARTSQCPACGVIYEKWLKSRYREARRPEGPEGQRDRAGVLRDRLAATLLVPRDDGRLEWSGRVLLLLLLGWFTVEMVTTGYEEVVTGTQSGVVAFLHRIDLVFHEAGHVIFRLLGNFMMVLGGSLLQVLVPLIVARAFLVKNTDPFGASVGFWWAGQSLSDVAVYISDARALRLPLLGGGTGADRPGFHDWHNLLGRLDMLTLDRTLGGFIDFLGIVCMLLGLAWGFYLVWIQHRKLSA